MNGRDREEERTEYKRERVLNLCYFGGTELREVQRVWERREQIFRAGERRKYIARRRE